MSRVYHEKTRYSDYSKPPPPPKKKKAGRYEKGAGRKERQPIVK